MQFEYEISIDDYIASQRLLWKLSHGRRRIRFAIALIIWGVFFIFIAWEQHVIDWAPILLAGTGAWLIFAALRSIFPRRYLRNAYKREAIAGKKYRAEINEEGFETFGEDCDFRVRWAGVKLKGENKQVFILNAGPMLYMFGKKYMTEEQQHEFRKLATLPAQ